MTFDLEFQENSQSFDVDFGEIQSASDGGFEQGYAAGYEKGLASAPDYLAMRLNGTLLEYIRDDVVSIDNYAFFRYSNLKSICVPNCVSIGSYAFQYCTNLESITFANAKSIGESGGYTFSQCPNLQKADFGNAEVMGTYTFQACSKLDTLIIRSEKVCSLKGLSAINSTPIYNGDGSVYVPDKLVNAYKNAYNWSTIASKIKPISELPN